MYHSISLLPDLDDEIEVRFSAHIPVITFDGGGSSTIHVPGNTAEEQVRWLTAFADKLTAFADEVSERERAAVIASQEVPA